MWYIRHEIGFYNSPVDGMGSGRERQHAQWQQRWLAAWLFRKKRRWLHAAFCGATRPFSIPAVSSIDIIVITGRHTIPEWQWRRCKIIQKWPCGAEWRPQGSSAIPSAWHHECRTLSSGARRLRVAYRIWLGKHRWTCFHARWCTATLCTKRTCLVRSEVSGTLAVTTRTSRMACKKCRSHALWLFPVGVGKGGGVPGKTSHNGIIGGPDSERYH